MSQAYCSDNQTFLKKAETCKIYSKGEVHLSPICNVVQEAWYYLQLKEYLNFVFVGDTIYNLLRGDTYCATKLSYLVEHCIVL